MIITNMTIIVMASFKLPKVMKKMIMMVNDKDNHDKYDDQQILQIDIVEHNQGETHFFSPQYWQEFRVIYI